MMRTPAVILLWFLFVVVSSIIPSGTSNEHTVEQNDSGTWPEQYRASIDDDEEAIVSAVGRETRSSLEDGRQKSGAREAGLTRREMRSVQEASSGTDWGGLLLRLAATQGVARRTGNFPPIISLLASIFEKPESVVYESRQNRRRRWLTDFPISEYTKAMKDPDDEDEIKKILANAKAQLSTVKLDNMEKFRDDDFGNNWLFFVLPFRSGIFTESLFKPRSKGYETGAKNWDASFSNTGQLVNYNEDVGLDFEKTINENYESSRSSVNSVGEYSSELAKEISWITEENQEQYKPNFNSKVIEKDGLGKIERDDEMDPELSSKEAVESDPDTDENLESHLQEAENGGGAKYETDTGLVLKEIPRDSAGTTEENYGTNVELSLNGTEGSDAKDTIDSKLLSNKARKSHSSVTDEKSDLESDWQEGKEKDRRSETSEEERVINTGVRLEEADKSESGKTNPELDLKERGNDSASGTGEKHETNLGESHSEETGKDDSSKTEEEYEVDPGSRLKNVVENGSGTTYDFRSQTKGAEENVSNTINKKYDRNTDLKTKGEKNVSTVRGKYEAGVESHLKKLKGDDSDTDRDPKSEKLHSESETKEAEKNVSTTNRKGYEADFESHLEKTEQYDSDATYDAKSGTKEARKDASAVTGQKYEANVESRLKEDSPDSQMKKSEKGDSRSDKQNRSDGREYLIKDDEHGSKSEDYRDVGVNVDVKSDETLLGDISIDNTTMAVMGADKPSTAELPVKIPKVHNKPSENKRLSSDKSLFIPVVLPAVESQDPARHYGKNYEESTARESSVARPDQSAVDEKLISNGILDRRLYQDLNSTLKDGNLIGNEAQSHRDTNLNASDKSEVEKSVGPSPPVKNETDEISAENDESKVTNEEDSPGLNIARLLDVRKQSERWRNLYEENRRIQDPGWNFTNVDGPATTDTRQGARRVYDKQKSAAETSVRVDAEERRGRIGEKSTSSEETRAARGKSLIRDGTGERDALWGDRNDYGLHSDEENVQLERTSLGEGAGVNSQGTKDPRELLKEFDKLNNSKYEKENLNGRESNVEEGRYFEGGDSRKKSETKNGMNNATEGKTGLENVERAKDFEMKNFEFDANTETSTSVGYLENEDLRKKSEADERVKVNNVIGKDQSEENTKNKQHDASDRTKETKFKVENSREKELQWRDANDGNKSVSKDPKGKEYNPGRNIEAESSVIGDLKSDKFESGDAREKKEFESARNSDSQTRKIEGGDEGSDEFKVERLKGTERESGNLEKERKHDPTTEKSEQSVERFESQHRGNALSTSDDSRVTARKENTTTQQGVEFSEEEEHNEFNEHVEKIDGNYSVSERETGKHAKYAINDRFEERTAKIKNDEIFKEGRRNAKHEESYVTRDGASFEPSAEGNKSRRQEYEATSREQSLNAHRERDTSENKGKGNERVTSREDASADEASDGKYNLRADRVETKHERKYEAAENKSKEEVGLSFVGTEINGEKLSSSEATAEREGFETRGDTSGDSGRKNVEPSRTRGKNKSSKEGNNALIKGAQLRKDGSPSAITVTAGEVAFVSGEIYEKSNGASASSARVNSTGKEPGIREENNRTLENNETYLARKLDESSENEPDATKSLNIASDRRSNGTDFVTPSNEISETSRESERISLEDLNGNRATNLSSFGARIGSLKTDSEDGSPVAIDDARVTELQGENEASRSNDIFGVTDTNAENDSANRTADEDQSGSRVNFGDLSNTGYSDELEGDNSYSLASQKVSTEGNESDKNKVPSMDAQREHESENKNVETNEVDNSTSEMPNETADRSVVNSGESERNEYNRPLSKESAKEIESKTHGLIEDNNLGSERDINTKVPIDKSNRGGIDSNESGRKYIKSDEKGTDTTESSEDRAEQKGDFRKSGTLTNVKDESDPPEIKVESEHSTETRLNSNTDVQAELLIENHEGIDPVENKSGEGGTFANAKNVLDLPLAKIENGSDDREEKLSETSNFNSNIDPSARLFIENQENIHHDGESGGKYTGRDNVDPGERNQNYFKTDRESIDPDKSNQKHIEEVGYRETGANEERRSNVRTDDASTFDSSINISTKQSVGNQRDTDPRENEARDTLDSSRGKISAFSYKSEDESRARARTDDALKLNLNNELKSDETKGLGTGSRERHEDKTVANGVNLQRAPDSFSARSSKFSGNTATSGERNISSVAINQASEEESEKEGTTGGGNMAEDGSFKHSDSKMIGNLSLASSESNETEGSDTTSDEMLESDDLLSIARMLTAKNFEEIRNYYNVRDDRDEEINRAEGEDSTKGSEIEVSRRDDKPWIDIARKQASTTEGSGSNGLYVDERGVLNENESITRHSNGKKALEKGFGAGIEETVNNGERKESSSTLKTSADRISLPHLGVKIVGRNDEREGTTSNNSSSGDEITRNDAKECDEHATPSAPGQLIDNNVLEAFHGTGVPPALNTKTTSEPHSLNMDENTIKSRLPGATAARPINWTDNERSNQPPVEATSEETPSGGETSRTGAARLSKFDPEVKSFRANEDSTDKGKESARDAKRLRDDEAERASESIANGFNDISVENEASRHASGDAKFANSAADTSRASVSLNESDYRTDVGVNANRQAKVDPSRENDLLSVRGNANVENTNDTLDREHDTNGEHLELDIYDGDHHKSETPTIAHAAEDEDNLLSNGERVEHGEGKLEDPVLKLLLNRENQTQSWSNEPRIDGYNSGKSDQPLSAGTKLELDNKLNKETSEGRPTQESESYKDKLYDAEHTISQSAGDLHGTSEDEKETQIQRPLTEAEIAVTRSPGLRQQQRQNVPLEEHRTYSKPEDKQVSSENYFGDPLKLNVENKSASDTVSIKSDNTPNTIVASKYEDSALNDSSSDSKKITYDSDTENELRKSLKKNTDLKSNARRGDVESESKELTLNKSEEVSYELNRENELSLKGRNNFEIATNNSHYTSNVIKNDLHSQYQGPTLIITNPLNVAYGSEAQEVSRLNSKKDIDPQVSIESQYASSTAANDSYGKLKDPVLTASNLETVTHESSTRDQSNLNLKERLDSDASVKSHTTNTVEINSRDDSEAVTTVPSDSKNDSKFSTKFYYASNAPKDNLDDQPLKITYESKLKEQSSLDAKTDADTSIESPSTSSIDENNFDNKFKDPTQTGSSKESIERYNSKAEKNRESVIGNLSEDDETLSVSELGDQHREVNVSEINVPIDDSTTESSTNAAGALVDEKEESTKSGKPLPPVSPTISSELDAKFAKKLQSSSDEFAKPQQKVPSNSEPYDPVSSAKVKSHSGEREPARSASPSSYNSLSKPLSLFTRFQDDARDNQVSSTYSASIGEPISSNVANVKSKSYEPASILQKAIQDKAEVYIVKQNSEGLVNIAHVENMKPLVVTSKEISKNLYDKIVDMFRRSRIESGSSSKT